jgi:serine/threonine protein kinase
MCPFFQSKKDEYEKIPDSPPPINGKPTPAENLSAFNARTKSSAPVAQTRQLELGNKSTNGARPVAANGNYDAKQPNQQQQKDGAPAPRLPPPPTATGASSETVLLAPTPVLATTIPASNISAPIGVPANKSGTNLQQQQNKATFYMNYELRDEIGVGSTSKCYKCIKKSDGKEYACKVIDKRQVEMKFSGLLDQFFVEIKVLKALKHPNIIKLEDTFESPDRIYMIMEIMQGGELFDYVVEKGTLSEEEASVLVRKITSAVAHMHSLDIIHRDLKPENLLLTKKGPNAEVKLIDFGLAKVVVQETVANSFLGTKGYLAPEMLQRHSYDKAIDMWALGVIVFVLLCGCLPFDDDSSKINSESAVKKKFSLRFPKWAASLSNSAKDLLQNLLDTNPKTRYTAQQALNHPWVSGKTVQPNSYLQSPSVLGRCKH